MRTTLEERAVCIAQLRGCDSEPNESVAAYVARAERVARERLASIEHPASHEAPSIIFAAGHRA